MNNKNKTILYIVIGVIVVGGIGFLLGNAHGAAAAGKSRTAFAQTGTRATGRGGSIGGNAFSGQILSNDGTTITIGLSSAGMATSSNSAGSRIILLSGSTQILKATIGSSSDLVVGTPVTVSGTTNSDGSVTATAIQIRSNLMGGQGGYGGMQGGAQAGTQTQRGY